MTIALPSEVVLTDEVVGFRISEQEAYLAHPVRLAKPTATGSWSRAMIVHTDDGGQTWSDVPLRRCLQSRLGRAMFAPWPPEFLDRIWVHHAQLFIAYRDTWVPYERPILPFGLDTESAWIAQYHRPSKCWRLELERLLDYDGADLVGPLFRRLPVESQFADWRGEL